jgi:Dna[CI] antecedent DciA-like protein
MRGRRRTLASVLAEALAPRREAEPAAIAAALAEACGPRLAREASFRGVMRDGRLLVVVRTAAWAAQVEALAPELCRSINARLGRPAAAGLDVRVAAES